MGHIVTIAKVDGIERFMTTHGHTLECDNCGEQYNGGNDEDKGGPLMPDGYRGISPATILDHGERLGWTGLDKYKDWTKIQGMAPSDLCPVCSAMKGAPYWPVNIHEPLSLVRLWYVAKAPLVQKHTVVLPMENRIVEINTNAWPRRDRYNQPPAVLEVKFITKDSPFVGLSFESKIRWPGQKGKPQFKEKSPLIRLWSWGDGKVYAKEVSPKR
jgi:hypothetical protein